MNIRTITIACAFFPLVLSGCLEEEVQTNIAPDGSVDRVISFTQDSKEVPAKAFPAGTGPGWTAEWKERDSGKGKFQYIARKHFDRPEELSNEYASLPDTNRIGIQVSVDRSFQWFFTYFTYTEVYSFRNPFGHVPVTDYLTKEEIDRYVGGDENDTLKRKVELWTSRDMLEDMYLPLIAEARRRNDPALPAQLLEEKRTEVFSLIMRADSINSARKKEHRKDADSLEFNVDNPDVALKLMAKAVGTDAVLQLRQVFLISWKNTLQKLEQSDYPDGWTSSVHMPGLIVETNSNAVEGSAISWKFGPDQVRVGNYIMHAQSRLTNVWAFGVTAALLLLVTGLGIVSSRRRGKTL